MKFEKKIIGEYILAGGLFFLTPYLLEKVLSGFWLTLFLLFGINVILAISLNIINGWIGFFSVGHGGIMLVGAYVAAFLTLPTSFKEGIINLNLPAFILNIQIPLLPALLIGAIFGTIAGVILVLPAIRLRGFYFCAGTLGFNIIMINLAENLHNVTNGPMGLRHFPSYTNIWWVWGIASFLVYITLMLKNSYIGRAFISIGKDQCLAEHMGINLLKYKIYAFGFSAFFTSIGAILWVHLVLNLYPAAFSLTFVFMVVTMIVIGGMGSVSGSIIGAAIVTLFTYTLAPLEEGFSFLGFQVPQALGLTTILLGILLIVVLIKKPEGIMGEREISLKLFKEKIN